jgi:4-amino-4-deoxy-L-arabinose transferase-like glycosyltransferase
MKQAIYVARAKIRAVARIRLRGLLIAAAALHLLTVTAVFVMGRFSLMPSQFDRNGLGEFAHDSYQYQLDLILLANKLRVEGIASWLGTPAPFHVKLYSLSHVLFSHWTSFNVLSIEPLNLAYYLFILFLVYRLTETIFDRRAAVLALAVVALWPSFLVHTTQLLRDPLFITTLLALVLVVATWLTKTYRWRWGFVSGIAGGLSMLLIWIVRLAMWDVARVVAAVGFVLLVVRQIRQRRVLIGNLIAAVLLIAAALTIPRFRSMLEPQQTTMTGSELPIAERVLDVPLWERIAKRREAFVTPNGKMESSKASNVDESVQFQSWVDIIRYLPRAIAIGFFAPFPNMWFAGGSLVGNVGRRLSGLEMILTYVIELFAIAGIWSKRRHPVAWLLVVIITAGLIGLGLTVLNIGSLYRVRYPFWMLMLALGAGGAQYLASKLSGSAPSIERVNG